MNGKLFSVHYPVSELYGHTKRFSLVRLICAGEHLHRSYGSVHAIKGLDYEHIIMM